MSRYAAIDLQGIAPPAAVEVLDYEVVLAALRAEALRLAPELTSALALESEPSTKILQVWAYREVLLRARINDAVRAVLLPTATGTNLDNLAALFGVQRQLLDPGDSDASPPRPPVVEGDSEFRRRVLLSMEGFSTAGPRGAYEFHALSADARVADVGVRGIGGGVVEVAVLSREGDGTAPEDLIAAVDAALNDEDVRPLTDDVRVQSATIVSFSVEATVLVADLPGSAALIEAGSSRLAAYLAGAFRVGQIVRRSAIIAALHVEGVEAVELSVPAADVDPGPSGAARAATVEVTAGAAV